MGSSPFTGYPRNDGNDIYLLDVSSRQQVLLSRYSPNMFSPSWSPDGTRILFASFDGGSLDALGEGGIYIGVDYEIYAMNADGSDIIRLTDSPGEDMEPVWSPVGGSGTNVTATSWGR